MCGRFVGFRNLEQLRQYFPIDEARSEAVANFNVAPTQEVLAIARLNGANVLDRYHWGLVPFWAKDVSIGQKMINARSETVAIKPSFREGFKRRRCLIPADGFYEWLQWKGKKQPMFITLPDETPFAFAGLWEIWTKGQSRGNPYRSCTIITRESVGAMKDVHHRMPVILHPDAYNPWLDPGNDDLESLHEILQTRYVADLVFRSVGTQVNSVRSNDPSNILSIEIDE